MILIRIETYDELVRIEKLLVSANYGSYYGILESYKRYGEKTFSSLVRDNLMLVSYSTIFKRYSVIKKNFGSTLSYISENKLHEVKKSLGLPIYTSRKISR